MFTILTAIIRNTSLHLRIRVTKRKILFLIARNPKMICEIFIVFCCLPQCQGKNWENNVLVAISQKSKKERTQLYIECDFELLRCSEKNNKWPGKHQVKIGSRSEFYCCTHSLISTTYVASPPIGSRVATKITSSDLTGLIRWFKWRYFLFSRKKSFPLSFMMRRSHS